MKSITRLMAIALAILLPLGANAQETLLTVASGGNETTYDMAALQQFETAAFTTTTIWTEGAQSFEGVPLSALLADTGIASGTIRAVAINDYAVEIPVADVAGAQWPIVAYKLNGKPMSVRDKGPLWIVYPYDADPAFQSEVTYSRSIWQLARIDLKD